MAKYLSHSCVNTSHTLSPEQMFCVLQRVALTAAAGLSHTGERSEEQGRALSGVLLVSRELADTDKQAGGQRWCVVARVQHVGLAALTLLTPQDVRARRKERPQALSVQLQRDAQDCQSRPHTN